MLQRSKLIHGEVIHLAFLYSVQATFLQALKTWKSVANMPGSYVGSRGHHNLLNQQELVDRH